MKIVTTQKEVDGWTFNDWMAYYRQLSLKELKRVVGESMGMSTKGTRADLLGRIRQRHNEVESRPIERLDRS